MSEIIKVGMADLKTCVSPNGVTTLGLGSCVGIALRDPVTQIGGLAHIMLPDSTAIRNANQNIAKALQVLAKKAGIYGMIGGQVVDIQSEGSKDMTKDKLDFIYRLKTGALMEASMVIGAILAGATESEQQTVEKVAGEIGLAFQIQDDILDVTSTAEVLGKPIGSDEKNDKFTYVTFEGLEKAKADVAAITEQAVAHMNSLEGRNEFLNELLLYLIAREK